MMTSKKTVIAGLAASVSALFLTACSHTAHIDSISKLDVPSIDNTSGSRVANIVPTSNNLPSLQPASPVIPQVQRVEDVDEIANLIQNSSVIESFSSIDNDETRTSQLIGHWHYCRTGADGCGAYAQPNLVVENTPFLMSILSQVTLRGNQDILPAEDIDIYGETEKWILPVVDNETPVYGDCEDYSLYKRQILIDKYNIPPSALAIYAAQRPDGEAHAFLGVRTDSGVVVLDNLTNEVLALSDVPYEVLKRQSYVDGGTWAEITNQDYNGAVRTPITQAALPSTLTLTQ